MELKTRRLAARAQWLYSLESDKRSAAIAAIENYLATFGLDICKTEHGKPLGQGLFEFRIRHDERVIRRKAEVHLTPSRLWGISHEPPTEESPMTTQFDDFVREVEERSTVEERQELETARARFRIGARVLQRRLAAGLTQQQLAELSGISQADISRIERGQSNPTAETLEALAGPLGLTIDLVPEPAR